MSDTAQLIPTMEAAQLLAVEPNTLRHWQERYDFPRTYRSSEGRRRFRRDEVLALRAALREESSPAAAVARARANMSRRDLDAG
jgi:DNA-binding transcriptional MerR regulator